MRPDAGTATIAGHDLLSDPVGVQRSISLTGQYAAIDEVLTGRENLEMMAQLRRFSRRAARARAAELLAAFDLTEARDRRAGTYSGGMKRRLDLAISMIERPALLFLDEPTTGLDPRSREQLWASVRALVDDGVTVVLTTQYLEEADRLADAVVVLDRGRVIAEGGADELKAQLGSEVVRIQFADRAAYRRALPDLPVAEVAGVDQERCTVEVATDGRAGEVLALLSHLADTGTPALRVSTHRPSLDDVFRSLTGTAGAEGSGSSTAADLEEVIR